MSTNRKCSVILPDGSVEKKDCNLANKVITLTSALSATPNVNSIWMLESEDTGESPQTFRVISVDETDGVNYAISALSYRSEKYDNIESNDFSTLPARSTSLLNQPRFEDWKILKTQHLLSGKIENNGNKISIEFRLNPFPFDLFLPKLILSIIL